MQRSENMQGKYPDIIARVPACLQDDVKTLVIDCEAVAWDKETKKVLPFQVRWACWAAASGLPFSGSLLEVPVAHAPSSSSQSCCADANLACASQLGVWGMPLS